LWRPAIEFALLQLLQYLCQRVLAFKAPAKAPRSVIGCLRPALARHHLT
jgi:hypothetical protein